MQRELAHADLQYDLTCTTRVKSHMIKTLIETFFKSLIGNEQNLLGEEHFSSN